MVGVMDLKEAPPAATAAAEGEAVGEEDADEEEEYIKAEGDSQPDWPLRAAG